MFPGQGVVNFEASQQLQRAGLTLASGTVYAAFGSHCGAAPYQVTLMSHIMSQRMSCSACSYGSYSRWLQGSCMLLSVSLRGCALPGALSCHAYFGAV